MYTHTYILLSKTMSKMENKEFVKNVEVVQSGADELGNTKPIREVKKGRVNPSNGWHLVLNNYTEDETKEIYKLFPSLAQTHWFIVGKEKAPSTGTPHLQGYLALKDKDKRMRWDSLGLSKRIKWIAAKGSKDHNLVYCSKDFDFITNIKAKPKLKPIILWKEWQKNLEKQLTENEPDDRKIHWYWSEAGGTGKSSFVKYMYDTYQVGVVNKGKYSDMINQIYNFGDDVPEIILIDIPRGMKAISYAALEDIKNGLVCNSKYETGTLRFNPPHIVVFCNFEIEAGRFSIDRIESLCLDISE